MKLFMDANAFQREAGNFGVDWTVKFAEASIDAVSDAYARFRKCEIARNVSLASSESAPFPPRGILVQPAISDWVIVLHEWGRFVEFPLLSGIHARTLEFGGSAGSRAETCNLFTPSRPIVRYRIGSVVNEENEYFDASRTPMASRPAITVVSSYERVFRHYKINPVFVYLDESRQVVPRAEDRPEILRVDVAMISS